MKRQPPNPLQKLVRGVLRDLMNHANAQNADKPAKPKTKKSTATSYQSKAKQDKEKRSRHIPHQSVFQFCTETATSVFSAVAVRRQCS
jgi:hypothetical protein